MTKKEVQKRVLQNGKMIDMNKFSWDSKTKTFSSYESNLVLDFSNICNCMFKTGSYCVFDTGSDCVFDTGSDCVFYTGYDCTFKTGDNCTFKTGDNCTFYTGDNCTFDTGSYCTFDTGYGCMFKTGDNCMFDTGYGCTFKTGDNCTFYTGDNCTFKTGNNCTFYTGDNCTFDTGNNCMFDTGDNCTFKTGNNCMFDTSYDCIFNTGSKCIFNTDSKCIFKTGCGCMFNTDSKCTFDTGYDCTFDTGYDCTFKTGSYCVIIRRDIFQVIVGKTDIKLCPNNVPGYLENISGKYFLNGDVSNGEHIIVDNILSKVISKKRNVYKVQNYNQDDISYLIKDNEYWVHGKTLSEAKKSLLYKRTTKDLSKFQTWKMADKKTQGEIIEAYRSITGACEGGVKYFCENNKLPEKCTIQEAIEFTKGQYNHELFKNFFNK